MKNIKKITFSLTALVILSAAAMTIPVNAHGNSADDKTTSSNSSDDARVSHNPGDVNTDDSRKSSRLAEQFHRQGDDKLKMLREQNKQRPQTDRQKSCTARKAALKKRMTNSVAHAQRHKAVFDRFYTKVKEFHDAKQLNVPDYTALTAKVDAAQTNAQNSIDALKALDVSVDCTSETVANDISAFQEAVKATRDSLKDYRKSLVELITAMKGASTGANDDAAQTDSAGQ